MDRIIDRPQQGKYRMRLVRDGPWVPVKIWFGAPPDPHRPGELIMDAKRWCWQVLVDGERGHDVYAIWPRVIDHRIDELQYYTMLRQKQHDRLHDPANPTQAARKPIDWQRTKPIF